LLTRQSRCGDGAATEGTAGPPRRVNLDENLSMTRSGNTYYYMADGLGSVRNIGESDEDTANTYDYYAFGNTLGTPTVGVTNPYEYTAREYESGSVLDTYYYRNRYYMSALGIFTSRDAMWADVHRGWGYVGGSPLMYSDPYGLAWGGLLDDPDVGQPASGSAGGSDPGTCPSFLPQACWSMAMYQYNKCRASGKSVSTCNDVFQGVYEHCLSLGGTGCPYGFEALYVWQAAGFESEKQCREQWAGKYAGAFNEVPGYVGWTMRHAIGIRVGISATSFFAGLGAALMGPGTSAGAALRALGIGFGAAGLVVVGYQANAAYYAEGMQDNACGKLQACVPVGTLQASLDKARAARERQAEKHGLGSLEW